MFHKTICAIASVATLLAMPVAIARAQPPIACRAPAPEGEYCVGSAKREITPPSPVYLGGYGFGPVRRSTGVASPIYARAIAISRGAQTVVFGAIETQGHFLAYQEGGGPTGEYGFADIRRRVSNDLGVPERNLIIASTHDHAGPDDIGVWGGVPPAYLKLVAGQAVAAIESAIQGERLAHLHAAEIDTSSLHLLRNLLPPRYGMDYKLRVLLATDPSGASLATLINFSAHATTLGGDNTLISPDWPGAAARAVETASPGSTALVMVASVGRTQPELGGIAARGLPRADEYGRKVAELAVAAEASATKVDGPVAAAETTLNVAVENPVLGGLMMRGSGGVDRVMRSNGPPYFAQGVIRTVVGAARIGNLFFAAVPGESFPETEALLEQRVAADGHYLFSLAEDQLGYDPPPYEVGMVEFLSPLDEGLFIVNSRFGADVTRTLLSEAVSLGFQVSDTSYSGDDAPANQPFSDRVKAKIGAIEEPIVRRLILIALWLGYNRFH